MSVAGESVLHHTITVDAPQEKAFAVFTEGQDRWWPRSYQIGRTALEQAVLEPRAGGRWYERDVDGGECDWGKLPEALQPTSAWSGGHPAGHECHQVAFGVAECGQPLFLVAAPEDAVGITVDEVGVLLEGDAASAQRPIGSVDVLDAQVQQR